MITVFVCYLIDGPDDSGRQCFTVVDARGAAVADYVEAESFERREQLALVQIVDGESTAWRYARLNVGLDFEAECTRILGQQALTRNNGVNAIVIEKKNNLTCNYQLRA